MKRPLAGFAMVLAAAALNAEDVAPTNAISTLRFFVAPTSGHAFKTNFFDAVGLKFGALTNGPMVVRTNHLPPQRIAPLKKDVSAAPPVSPAPGLYESAPYSMIVLVPDRGYDEKFVVNLDRPALRMPVIRPDVRLIPRNPADK